MRTETTRYLPHPIRAAPIAPAGRHGSLIDVGDVPARPALADNSACRAGAPQ
ncbi:hypothetical protein ACSNOB_00270 [Micromonospora sp. URMC 106]|uniref:hypothetical protein n=1 Tax=Micromonospora sp. URMC 106 TaxID=3423408 RepID=UPI003F1A5513